MESNSVSPQVCQPKRDVIKILHSKTQTQLTFVGFGVGLRLGLVDGLSVGSGAPVGLGVVKQLSYDTQLILLQHSFAVGYDVSQSDMRPPHGGRPEQLWTHFEVALSTYHGSSRVGRDVFLAVGAGVSSGPRVGLGVLGAIVGQLVGTTAPPSLPPSTSPATGARGQTLYNLHSPPQNNSSQHLRADENRKNSRFPGSFHSAGKLASFVHVSSRLLLKCHRALQVVSAVVYSGFVPAAGALVGV